MKPVPESLFTAMGKYPPSTPLSRILNLVG